MDKVLQPAKNKSKINNKLILGPMVRLNTFPFRKLCIEHGCDIVFTEELIAKKLKNCKREENECLNTIDFKCKKTGILVLRTTKEEKSKLCLQIGAANKEDAIAAIRVCENDITYVDLNMGCPKPFSTHGNMGSALLKLPAIAADILSNIKKEFPSLIVSCKIRLLPDWNEFKNLLYILQNSGIDYFTIHLRFKDEGSKAPARWDYINKIKEIATIPFVVNGDILSPKDIQYLKKTYNVNSFMIARGAIHNPNIFSDYLELCDDLNVTEFSNDNSYNIDKKGITCKTNKITENDMKKFETNDEIESNNIKLSVNLSRSFDNKYGLKNIDILSILKEYIIICVKYANYFGNVKFNILYILRTHKKYNEIFQKLSKGKSYDDFVNILGVKDEYDKVLSDNPNILNYINQK